MRGITTLRSERRDHHRRSQASRPVISTILHQRSTIDALQRAHHTHCTSSSHGCRICLLSHLQQTAPHLVMRMTNAGLSCLKAALPKHMIRCACAELMTTSRDRLVRVTARMRRRNSRPAAWRCPRHRCSPSITATASCPRQICRHWRCRRSSPAYRARSGPDARTPPPGAISLTVREASARAGTVLRSGVAASARIPLGKALARQAPTEIGEAATIAATVRYSEVSLPKRCILPFLIFCRSDRVRLRDQSAAAHAVQQSSAGGLDRNFRLTPPLRVERMTVRCGAIPPRRVSRPP